MPDYILSLSSFHIFGTRSPETDTIYVTFKAKVNNNDVPGSPQNNVSIGNFSSSGQDYTTGLNFVFTCEPTDSVTFSYQFVNNGAGENGEKYVNLLSDAADKLCTGLFGYGFVWNALNDITHQLNDFIFGYCDGYLVADAFSGTPGGWLSQGDPHSDGPHDYPGKNSPDGCGSNSHYNVTWSIGTYKAKEKEGKDGGKDVKEHIEKNLPKETDSTNFGVGLGGPIEMFPQPESSDTLERPSATGQAFIRAEERPDVGGQLLQQPDQEQG